MNLQFTQSHFLPSGAPFQNGRCEIELLKSKWDSAAVEREGERAREKDVLFSLFLSERGSEIYTYADMRAFLSVYNQFSILRYANGVARVLEKKEFTCCCSSPFLQPISLRLSVWRRRLWKKSLNRRCWSGSSTILPCHSWRQNLRRRRRHPPLTSSRRNSSFFA